MLAALVLAALWPQRFPGGYVLAAELPDLLKDFPRHGPSIRVAIKRARKEVRDHLPGLELEGTQVRRRLRLRLQEIGSCLATTRRPRSRTSQSAISPHSLAILRAWYLADGITRIHHGTKMRFSLSAPGIFGPPYVLKTLLHAEAALAQARFDIALGEIHLCMKLAPDHPERDELTLFKVQALLGRGGPGDLAEAGTLLAALRELPGSPRSLEEELRQARIALARAEWLYCDSIQWGEGPTAVLRKRVTTASALLGKAVALSQALRPDEVARLRQLEGLLSSKEADLVPTQERQRLLERAETAFTESLSLSRDAGDYPRVLRSIHYLAEVLYAQYCVGHDLPPYQVLHFIHEAYQESEVWEKLLLIRLGTVAPRARRAELRAGMAVHMARAGHAKYAGDILGGAMEDLAEARRHVGTREGALVAQAAERVEALAKSVGLKVREC